MLRVRCFDGVDVADESGSHALTNRSRHLIAVLVAAGHGGVERDDLIERLYGPGTQRRNALHKAVSRLNDLAGNLVLLSSGRYHLAPDVVVDVWELESAVANGSVAQIADLLAGSAGYVPYRGQHDDLSLVGASERVQRLCAVGWEQVAACVDRTVMNEFERPILDVANDDLCNERLITVVAAALYRLDRQTVALDLLARCRRELRDELGLQPGTEFGRVEQAILRHDPLPAESVAPQLLGAVELTHQTSLSLPVPPSTLVGREKELRALADELEATRSGTRGRFVMIEGEGGIGKTQLVREFARQASASGVVVRLGEGATHEVLAYEPFASALPELEGHLEMVAQSVEPGAARLVLWREVSRQLANLARSGAAVIILEDLHDSDSQSALLLRFLAGGLPAGVMLVVTTRPPDPNTTWSEVHTGFVMASLSGAVTLVDVEPLGHDACRDFVGLHFPTAQEAQAHHFATQLASLTGGNPLVMESICRSIDRPTDLRTQQWGETPEQAFVASLHDSVDDTLCEVLGVAGVIGLEFDLLNLANLLGSSEDVLIRDLERALRRGLVRESATFGRFRFDHVLMRDFFVSELSLTRRKQLSSKLALTTSSLPDARVRWVRTAHDVMDIDDALRLLREDQRSLSSTMSFAESVAAGELALALLESSGRVVPIELLVELSVTAAQAGDFELSTSYRKRAFALARESNDVDAMAQAATAGLPDAEEVEGDPVRLQMLLEINPNELSEFPKGWFARCLFRSAWLLNDYDLCEQIRGDLELVTFEDDPLGAAVFLTDTMTYENQIGERSLGSQEFAAVAADLVPSAERAYVRFQGLIHGLIANEANAATTLFDEVRAEIEAYGSNRIRWTSQMVWAALEMTGARDDGPSPEAVLEFGVQHGVSDAFLGYGSQRLLQHWLARDLEPIYHELEAFGDSLPNAVSWRATKTLAALSAGNVEVAEAERDRVMEHLVLDQRGVTSGAAAMVMAAAAAQAEWTSQAAGIMGVLDVHAGRNEVLGLGSAVLGPVDAARAAMARLLGNASLASELEDAAERQLATSGMVNWAGMFDKAST